MTVPATQAQIEALEFYADRKTWEWDAKHVRSCPALQDFGVRARAALRAAAEETSQYAHRSVQIEALELIDTFAWSCVKTDCEESRIELQRRINECRAALTAAPKADVRFREFGNGATWVDFPMTQEASDILHELKVREPCMIDMDGVRPAKANRPQYIILDIKERDEIIAALTAAAAEAGVPLRLTQWDEIAAATEAGEVRNKLEQVELALKKRGLFIFEHIDGTVSINDR